MVPTMFLRALASALSSIVSSVAWASGYLDAARLSDAVLESDG